MVSEILNTYLKTHEFEENFCSNIRNFNIFYKRENNYSSASDRVATYVKSNIETSEIPINTPLKITAVTMILYGENVTINM